MLVQCEVCNNSMKSDDEKVPICEECLKLNSREYWEKVILNSYDY